MKAWLGAATFVMFSGLVTAQSGGTGSGVIHLQPADVNAALAKGATLVNRPDLIVSGGHREVNGQVEMHDKETDVLYIVDGEATFAWGGKMVGGKVSAQDQWLGTDITGGQTQRVSKGDVFVVPAGIPHWFKEVPKSVSYFVVKVKKP
jgi:mannose-6-phosphate isomerase-like protein (cupin superfamily)